MVNLPHGQEIQGLHGVRSLFQGAILRLVRLNGLSVTTLADQKVLADFSARQVTLLRADWTRRDPAISAALAQLGRSGVPVYVLYQNGRAPVVLSELLSVQEVRAMLAKLKSS